MCGDGDGQGSRTNCAKYHGEKTNCRRCFCPSPQTTPNHPCKQRRLGLERSRHEAETSHQ
ncbi:T-complex protein 1 subunit beta [Histoplasma capsulatum var. duboisii H88]|uniref:T-complex protein 1 subunit beta n=1 Tax=Ajellomyces capsulatus (strain H88) TaxID=544711 RepID=A0A8A1LQB5_AJEC8|nr:T-complex protein 1 subunit beta [Histoplasma capsulatum var. duboisii H88]